MTRVVVTGATGNVGWQVVRALAADAAVDEVVGVARRVPEATLPGVTWWAADVARDDLDDPLSDADVVIHLAWQIQPARDGEQLRRVNVDGTQRLLDAAGRRGVRRLVVASSVGAYAPGPVDRRVDESWPTTGTPTSTYAVQKAEVERRLDRFEGDHPDAVVTRVRTALVFQRLAASEQARIFTGGALARVAPWLLRHRVPLVPADERLRFQVVHAADAAEAYRRLVHHELRGGLNVATEPPVDGALLAELLGGRPVPTPAWLLDAGASLTYRLRLQPTPPGWVHLALAVPLLDTGRAREELGWTPRHDARATLLDALDGIRDRAGAPTEPLQPVAEPLEA